LGMVGCGWRRGKYLNPELECRAGRRLRKGQKPGKKNIPRSGEVMGGKTSDMSQFYDWEHAYGDKSERKYGGGELVAG